MPILEAHNITKLFPGVKALDNVDIIIEEGKVNGIIGENGAGKSTLVKVLTGVYKPDKGTIKIKGKNVIDDETLFEKVSYVPQELNLFNHMSVAENLFMPFNKTGFKRIVLNQKIFHSKAIPLLETFKINVSPDDYVKNISVSNKQLLQVARAVANKFFEILILDEPTTSLTQKDTDKLFEVITQLKSENKSIIFISHKLEEIFALCDTLTVLRDGQVVGKALVNEVDKKWVVKKMSGRNIDENFTYRPKKVTKNVVLSVRNLSGVGFSNINFELHKGEILGFAGLIGAGRSEIMQTIFGILPAFSGEIKLEDKPWKFKDPVYSIKHGLFYLPEERKEQGILPDLSVRENISIQLLKQLKKGIAISANKEKEIVKEVINSFNIKTPSLEQRIKYLSGGNQQKVIIGRVMFTNPKVVIFDEPTKGIDIATKEEIYKLMKELAEKGISIILISSELDELLKSTNRVITIYKGKITGEFETEITEKTTIMHSIIGNQGIEYSVN